MAKTEEMKQAQDDPGTDARARRLHGSRWTLATAISVAVTITGLTSVQCRTSSCTATTVDARDIWLRPVALKTTYKVVLRVEIIHNTGTNTVSDAAIIDNLVLLFYNSKILCP
jgi:hypothetical protein